MITKSDFLDGIQCPYHLWRKKNQKDSLPEPSIAEKFTMEQGNEVGNLAKRLFPQGKDLDGLDFNDNLARTKRTMDDENPIFEAGFVHDECYARADIIQPSQEGDGWELIEVKSGTSVKDINLYDVAFQVHVIRSSGIRLSRFYIMHLNKRYYREGDLDIASLFERRDVTEDVENILESIPGLIEKVKDIPASTSPPDPGVVSKGRINGNHDCKKSGCIDIGRDSVFNLYSAGKRTEKLTDDGIFDIKEIGDDFSLTEKQDIQKKSHLNNTPHVNVKKIKDFLSSLEYPLHYLDFEAFSTAVPRFDGLKPYSQVPFQYSLHIRTEENTEAEHKEYIYRGDSDPRKEFIKALIDDVEDKGSIIVYSKSFEVGRLKELATSFPEYSEDMEKMISRIVDLLVPFREFSYYSPSQSGSASIKKVLPALTGKNYEGMDIADGNTAAVQFYKATYMGEGDKRKIIDDLLEYCKLDTYAEVLIHDELEKAVR